MSNGSYSPETARPTADAPQFRASAETRPVGPAADLGKPQSVHGLSLPRVDSTITRIQLSDISVVFVDSV